MIDRSDTLPSEYSDNHLPYQGSIFLINKTAFLHIYQAVEYALSIHLDIHHGKIHPSVLITHPELELFKSKKTISKESIDKLFFDNNSSAIGNTLFNALGVDFDIIYTSDKVWCARSINFLNQVSIYKKGDNINKIASNWTNTKKEQQRWKGVWIETIVEGNNNATTHGLDWIDIDQVIYQRCYGVGMSGGSQTLLYKKDINGNWQRAKTLQTLIR